MKLQEIFDLLSGSELSLISVGGNEQAIIDENNHDKLVAFVNLGLLSLYRRFNLKQGRLVLALLPDQDRYKLTSEFALSTRKSRSPVRYILDSLTDPFKDDLLKVEVVKTDGGQELVLNDQLDPMSVLTPSTTILQVPMDIVNQAAGLHDWLRTSKLHITYRAKHPDIKIPLGYFDPSRVNLELPDAYVEALLYFIAARAHTPRGLQEEGRVGNQYLSLYEAECQRLEFENLAIDQGTANTRLHRAGWV